jgi:enoyl-[acyl-carrier-protein] reductase (NADH)
MEIPRPVLKGQKALIAGIANEHSIAFADKKDGF